MTSKERMLVAMKNGKPDMVPVAPDISNMIPCKLTGKPFWDIYLYHDPPLWKAYIDAVRKYKFDGWLVTDDPLPMEFGRKKESKTVIVKQTKDRIITRDYTLEGKRKIWDRFITVYYRNDPPTTLPASKLGLEKEPAHYTEITGVKKQNEGKDILKEIMEYMGDDGVVGISIWLPTIGGNEPEYVYKYYDNHDEVKRKCQEEEEYYVRRAQEIIRLKPDFILIGASGYLTLQSPAIARELGLSTIQRVTRMAKEANLPSQLHCCGKERALVEMTALETDLDSINPLEIPPMGDCDLKEIKQLFGKKLSLMGNLHTTEVMLRGSVEDVEREAKKCIDDAVEGGGFILSTGDQCGRDTPEENIFKMIEVARTYGKY